jgi:predicted amidohydrolase YtcJ
MSTVARTVSGLWLRDVEVDGRGCDVEVVGGVVTQLTPVTIDSAWTRHHGADVVDGAGGAVIPGLHDHHLHLMALASAAGSVDCSPAAIGNLDGLAAALRAAPDDEEWIRGTGYHESVAGDLDRTVLDRLVPDRPVRIQHRSGALWMLNSAALARVHDALDDSADVERGDSGEPTGRLWRYDARLRRTLPVAPPSLATVGRRLASYGLTGVTDATPDLDDTGLRLLAEAVRDGELPQRLTVLGAPLGATLPHGLTAGPWKLHLRDHELPTLEELLHDVRTAHGQGRAVAIHCVTRTSLLLSIAVLDDAGAFPGDRIEHASVVPSEVTGRLRDLGVRVVTQPDFLRTRGADYLGDVAPEDVPLLYPYARLLAAGVPTCAASDAPYGDADPWQVIASAVARRTSDGRVLGPEERVEARTALTGYLTAPDDPGGAVRRVEPGAPADLVLLDRPLASALENPRAGCVKAVWIAGKPIS